MTQQEAIPLGECTSSAMSNYFKNLNGHQVTDLYDLVMSEVERPFLATVMEHVNHNQTKAAFMLGISRSTLRKKLFKYGLAE